MESDPLPRVFLDSNVLFSAAYAPLGSIGALFALASEGRFEALVSIAVITEVVRNLQRKAPEGIYRLEAFLSSAAVKAVENPNDAEIERWLLLDLKSDARVAAAAVRAEVDYLCTGDRKLREVMNATVETPRAVTPRELLTLLGLP